MTHPGANASISSAEAQRTQILDALVDAGSEGVSEDRIRELGGRWWQERIQELQKDHSIGWDRVDGEVRYHLVASVERAIDTAAPPADGAVAAPVDSSLSTAQTLFPPPSAPHHREAA